MPRNKREVGLVCLRKFKARGIRYVEASGRTVWQEKVDFFVTAGKRKCVDVWSEGFSSDGNEGSLNYITKIIYANSISKNGMVCLIHHWSVELRDFCKPMKISKPRILFSCKTNNWSPITYWRWHTHWKTKIRQTIDSLDWPTDRPNYQPTNQLTDQQIPLLYHGVVRRMLHHIIWSRRVH